MNEEPKLSLIRPETRPITTAPEVTVSIPLYRLREKSVDFQHLVIHGLLPPDLLVTFGIDPITLRNAEGEVMVEIAASEDGHIWGLRLLNDIDRRDALIEIEMTDTPFGRISVSWVGMNDPRTPRFDIDHLPDGRLTLRGKAVRNLEAEAAAKIAGLAPGQVRRGLGQFQRLLNDLEQFFAALQHYEFEAEPLFYHTAVIFERHGFQYIQGRRFMERIHQGFLPGGELTQRLDNSTPFRDPLQAGSIRGRSWAIHDGILDEPWDAIKMLKRIGKHAGVDTAPGIPW